MGAVLDVADECSSRRFRYVHLHRSVGDGCHLLALPSTLVLATTALVLAVLFGVAIAFFAAYTRKRWLANLLFSLPPLGVAVPTFWVG